MEAQPRFQVLLREVQPLLLRTRSFLQKRVGIDRGSEDGSTVSVGRAIAVGSRFSLLVLSAALLTGCHTYQQATTEIQATHHEIQNASLNAEKTAPPVLSKAGYYVDTRPASFTIKPKWLEQQITLRAMHLPLDILMQQLLRNTHVIASFDRSVEAHAFMDLNYSGTIEGALKIIAAQLNADYQIESDHINWSLYTTRTFDIAFMPGSSTYLVGEMEGQTQNNNMPSTSSASTNQLNDQQYSNLKGRLSVWQDLEKTLNQLRSDEGKVMISESTTSVTVYDRPENVQAMARFITQLNKDLSQEVAIRVCVLEVQFNDQSNYGINWNVVAKTLGTQFNLTGNLADATNLVANSMGAGSGSGATAGIRIGKDPTTTLINALAQQGKVSVTQRPEVTTMNNQIASIRITQDTGYVQSVSTSFTPQYFSSSITPGNITDGFTLYVLPKIQNNQVFMQISSTISNLLKLEKVSNSPTDGMEKEDRSRQYQSIQVPTISEKQFNQRSVVTSGSTLIVAGYRSLRNETKEANLFGMAPLGGQGAARNNIETLVLITPTILRSTGQ